MYLWQQIRFRVFLFLIFKKRNRLEVGASCADLPLASRSPYPHNLVACRGKWHGGVKA